MNIKIADSWLREYLITKARPLELAEKLSLTSVSVEKVEKIDNDYVYDIEVTSNRLDLMSVIGIAREAFAILPRFGIDAKLEIPQSKITLSKEKFPILIKSDSKIVNRITTVAIDVTVKPSPGYIKERLEASGIRSLNNLIDVTNYVMRETGHPVHVFDYDRLNTSELTIRESKQGEKIITLDKKEHILSTGNIIAVNKKEEIVDLLGVMGTLNSVVTENTKRILLFLDNNEPSHIRKTSMSLGIRSEAAILNEKGVDPELAMATLTRGIELYSQIANGKVISEIYDDYPNKPKVQTITVTKEKIDKIIGVEISLKQVESILISLGFKTKLLANKIEAIVPSFRANDISLQEDIIEEIARVFGYHNLPSILPPLREAESYNLASDNFYWETRIKNTLKYWGFTEIYTYSMIPENLLEGPREEAVKIANYLSEDLVYMRKTIVPSLLQAIKENQNRDEIKLFELANTYVPAKNDLPKETLMLAGVIYKNNVSFFEGKGIIEQLLIDLGIKKYKFNEPEKGGVGASIYIGSDRIGEIELLDDKTLDFELNFEILLKHANSKKHYKGIFKYPPVIEDIALIIDPKIKTGRIIEEIKKQSGLIKEVTLLDTFKDSRTFHIIYQDPSKNLSAEEIASVRKKIIKNLEAQFNAELKK